MKDSDLKFDTPVREHSIIVSDTGFFPSQISLFAGEKLRIYFGSVKDSPSCLMIRGKEFYLSVNGKEIVESEVMFDSLGSYEFYCPSENYKGTITVLPRANSKKDIGRTIASEKAEEVSIIKVWKPRENP